MYLNRPYKNTKKSVNPTKPYNNYEGLMQILLNRNEECLKAHSHCGIMKASKIYL